MGDPARSGCGIGRRRRLRGGPGLAAGPAGRPRSSRQPGLVHAGEAAALFDDLGRLDANARFVYAATGLTVDMAFPVAYGLLLAILLFRLWRGGVPLYLLPLAMAAADVLENATIAALALNYAGAPSPFAWLAAVFTLVKTILIAATAGAAGIGTIRWLWVRLRR